MRPHRIAVIVCYVALLSVDVSAQEAVVGHIQVKCPPDCRVYLDGTLEQGALKTADGMLIRDVPSGPHFIQVAKPGFEPQELVINVTGGRVFVFRVNLVAKPLAIEEEGPEAQVLLRAKAGTLVVQSIPVECTIDIPSVELRQVQKTKDRWTAKGFPAGRHKITLAALGKTLTHEVEIRQNSTVRLTANFIDGAVESVTDVAQAAPPQGPEPDVIQPDAAAKVWVFDDFESGKMQWQRVNWGRPAKVTLVKARQSTCMKIEYVTTPKAQTSCVVQRLVPRTWPFESRDQVVLDVVSENESRVALALAFFEGGYRTFYESRGVRLKKGENIGVAFDLKSSTFKSAKSEWRHTAPIARPQAVTSIMLMIYTPGRGALTVDDIRFVRK